MSTADPLSFDWPTVRATSAHPSLPTPPPQLTGRIWRTNSPPPPAGAAFMLVSALAHAAALAALLIALPNVGVLNGTMHVIDVELVELPATELAADSAESSAEPQQLQASPLQPESEHELAEPVADTAPAPELSTELLPKPTVAEPPLPAASPPAAAPEPLAAPEPAPEPVPEPVPASQTAPDPMPELEPEPTPEPAAEAEPVPAPSAETIPYPAPRLALARPSTPTYPAHPPAQRTPTAAKAATQSTAPASASSRPAAAAGNSAAIDKYPGQILAQLRRALRYPAAAGRVAGEVLVDFTVSANGTASAIRIARSSGHPALDQAALDTVRRAAPFPAIPPGANRASWPFTVPLVFKR